MAESAVVAALKAATRDLLFPSEADEPFDVFEWNFHGPLTQSKLIELGEEDRRVKVKEVTLESLFDNLVAESAEDSQEDQATASRFRELLNVIRSNLMEIKVYRVGEVELNYYVVGRTAAGSWAGIIAPATET